jgi:hypothetical protein
MSRQRRSPPFDLPITFDGRQSVYPELQRRTPGNAEPVGERSGRSSVGSHRRAPSTDSVLPPRSVGQRHRRLCGQGKNAGQRSTGQQSNWGFWHPHATTFRHTGDVETFEFANGTDGVNGPLADDLNLRTSLNWDHCTIAQCRRQRARQLGVSKFESGLEEATWNRSLR